MCDSSFEAYGSSGGSPEFLTDPRIVRVRRDRTCEVCFETIPAGHFAVAISGKWDNRVETLYLHLQCRNLIDRTEFEDGYEYGQVLDDLRENYGSELVATHVSITAWASGGEWTPVEREEI